MRADLTVLDADPLTADADALVDARVLLTVSSGIVTHEPAAVATSP
jgi:predicted amidohydrolase YtcJ